MIADNCDRGRTGLRFPVRGTCALKRRRACTAGRAARRGAATAGGHGAGGRAGGSRARHAVRLPPGRGLELAQEGILARTKQKQVCVWSNATSLCCLRARIVACHARQTMGIRMTLLATERLFWHCGAPKTDWADSAVFLLTKFCCFLWHAWTAGRPSQPCACFMPWLRHSQSCS